MNDTATTAGTRTDPDFAFASPDEGSQFRIALAPIHANGPLGPLAQLPGTWTGEGFNTIWRPHHGGNQDRFLELNRTTEKLVFTKINGAIPNRGLLMEDIEMAGLTYMQQISETDSGAGLHIEPGIWAHVPRTTNPSEPQTVVRMASIPHGTAILAQGATQLINNGDLHIPENNIIPFPIGTTPPKNDDFEAGAQEFPELNLSINTVFRTRSKGVSQEMVRNPNIVLTNVLRGQTIKSRTFIHVSTAGSPIRGGGTANTAFLADAANPPGGNARCSSVEAKFWIETVVEPPDRDEFLQLQYTQLVQLDFKGLRWPHVTVATLRRR
jgi:hypothetical protein